MESEADLYKRHPPFIYLRIAGIYYKRTTGKGWAVIAKPDFTDWNMLHPDQLAVYRKTLAQEGLLNE